MSGRGWQNICHHIASAKIVQLLDPVEALYVRCEIKILAYWVKLGYKTDYGINFAILFTSLNEFYLNPLQTTYYNLQNGERKAHIICISYTFKIMFESGSKEKF